MINGYKIIEDENREKVLILYIDNSLEFGIDFNIKHNSSNMKNMIKKYIKKNKIKFDGEKIALSIGGVILAIMLLVETPNKSNDYNLVYANNTILPKNNIMLVEKKETNENKLEEVKENIENTTSIENIKTNKNNDTSKIKKQDNIIQAKQEETKVLKDNSNSQEIKEESIQESVLDTQEIIEESDEEDKNKVTIYRNNGQVITLSMNDYLIGVVGAEMPASFSIEALKAQAVIARTYALKRIEKGLNLTDTVSTQVYLDNNELRNKWGNSFDMYYNKIKEAVIDTNDLAIYYNNQYIDAVYHSTSNGKTEDSKYVWGNSIPYLVSVDSSWDKDTTSYLRTVTKDLENVLNVIGVNSSDFNILSRNESGRVLEIKIGDKTFSGVEFRNLLGLRSSDFDIEVIDNQVNITTRGYGHGVGLSQYGANEMAKKGYNFTEIVKYYYKGVNIR